MSTYTEAKPAVTVDRRDPIPTDADRARARRRAMRVTAGITAMSLVALAYLVAIGHTEGEQIWGPITAAIAALTGVLSLAFIAVRGRSRVARLGLIALWLTVAFFGFGGYQSHRLAFADSPTDAGEPRQGPPIAPLMFIGIGIAGTVSVRSGSKGD